LDETDTPICEVMSARSLELSYFEQMLNLIEQLQKEEKEKLLINASVHLNKMQRFLPNIQAVIGGPNLIHENYYDKQLSDHNKKINEILEELQALKVECYEMKEAQVE
jgi:hypothetical protein